MSDINRADDAWPRNDTTLLFYSCYFPDNEYIGEADLYARNLKFFLQHGVFHDHDPLYPAEYHFLFSFHKSSLYNASSILSLFDLVSDGAMNNSDRIVHTHLLDNPGVDIAAYAMLIRELGQSYVNKFTYLGALNCGVRGPMMDLISVDGATNTFASASVATITSASASGASNTSASASGASNTSASSSSIFTCKIHAHFLPHYVRRLGAYGRSFVAQTGPRGICNIDFCNDHLQSWAVFYHRIAFPVLYRQWQENVSKEWAIGNGEVGASVRVNRLGWFISSDDYLPFRGLRDVSPTTCEKRAIRELFLKYGGFAFRLRLDPALEEKLDKVSLLYDSNWELCHGFVKSLPSAPALQHFIQNSSEPLVPDALVDYVPGTGPRIDRITKPDDDDLFDPWLDEVRADRSWLSDINRADDAWPRSNTTLLFYSCYFPDNEYIGEADLYARNLKFFLRHGVFHDHDPLYPAEYHFLLSFHKSSLHNASSILSLFDLVSGGAMNNSDRIVYTHLLENPGVDIAAYSRLIRELGQSYVNKFTFLGAINCGVRGPLMNLTSVGVATDISSSSSSSSARVSASTSVSISSSSSSCKVHAHFLPHYLRRLGVYGRSFVAQTGMKALCNVDYAEDHVESLVVFYHRIAFPVLYRQWKIFDDGTSSMNNGVIGVSIRVNRLGWFMSSDDYLPFRAIRGISTTNCTKRDVVAEIIVPESSSSSLPLFMRNAGGNFGCGDVCDKELQSLLASQSQVYTQNLKACVTAH